MHFRAFTAHDGRHWEVWEAHPRLAERRTHDERRLMARDTMVRRSHGTLPPEEASDGWLVFRTEGARRRQQPIPFEWEKLDSAALESLLDVSRPSGPRSRVTE